MKINQAGLDLIIKFEGSRKRPYMDPAGYWTIGVGHLITSEKGRPLKGDKDRDVAKKMYPKGLDEATQERLLLTDLASTEVAVANIFKGITLSRNQYSALVSFGFNVGAGNLGRSTLAKKIKAGDFAGAADEFGRWNKAGRPAKVLSGLTRRREAERQLFLA